MCWKQKRFQQVLEVTSGSRRLSGREFQTVGPATTPESNGLLLKRHPTPGKKFVRIRQLLSYQQNLYLLNCSFPNVVRIPCRNSCIIIAIWIAARIESAIASHTSSRLKKLIKIRSYFWGVIFPTKYTQRQKINFLSVGKKLFDASVILFTYCIFYAEIFTFSLFPTITGLSTIRSRLKLSFMVFPKYSLQLVCILAKIFTLLLQWCQSFCVPVFVAHPSQQ